ncbi:MAG TPA: hypothetical protein VGC42_23620 [Kofleriaceae bacterium]
MAASAWPGRRSILIAVVGLIVAAIVWWRSTREPLELARRGAPPAVAAGPAAAPADHRSAQLPAPPVAPYPAVSEGLVTDDALTAYKKANVYPPMSRPLSKDQVDLLEPGKRQEVMRRTDHDEHVTYLFTADRYFVIGDQPLHASLVVQRDGAPITAPITQAYAVVLDPVHHQEPPIAMSYAAAASGGFAATLEPARLGLKRQAAIALYIEFDYGTGKQVGHFDVQYTPTSGVPARFNGKFADAVEHGSLIVKAGLEVTAAGHYVIDANLFDADNQPVAWTRYKGDLETGSHDVDLLFFGKVLVDGSAHGAFHIGQLRGARYVPDLDPDLEQMPPFSGSYTTAAYTTDQFSDAEWDSPDKQRMLELLSHEGGAGSHP